MQEVWGCSWPCHLISRAEICDKVCFCLCKCAINHRTAARAAVVDGVPPKQRTGRGVAFRPRDGDGDAATTGTCRYAPPDGDRWTVVEHRTRRSLPRTCLRSLPIPSPNRHESYRLQPATPVIDWRYPSARTHQNAFFLFPNAPLLTI